MMSMDDRVALAVFDKLVSDDVTADHAAYISQQVRHAMAGHDQLFVVKVVDSSGEPHACVMASPDAGLLKLYRLDIAALREQARQEMIEELDVDLALPDDGARTRIGL